MMLTQLFDFILLFLKNIGKNIGKTPEDGDFFISDWLRNRNTVEFLGIWERVHNPNFNYGEFAAIKSQAGLKEWVEKTNAIGIKATKRLEGHD